MKRSLRTSTHTLRRASSVALATLLVLFTAREAAADPCGMVPPIHVSGLVPIERIGIQKTYVFYKDGIETFVIRPGYRGRIDNFGMLIPFPNPPAIRKVPDDIFEHVAAAIDPPEVVVDMRTRPESVRFLRAAKQDSLAFYARDQVQVLRQEAIGMYEVAVLAAGSADALSRWMGDNGYRYPDGMDEACEDYIAQSWCFVAVKTRVGNKGAVDPKPGQRDVDPSLPAGSAFDGKVQAMGFRFRSEKLVVPMRLSSFNPGELRNVVYVLADGPKKIAGMPEEFVVRQLPGSELYKNLTELLPVRCIGTTYDALSEAYRNNLKLRRDPTAKNGQALDLFASDLLAVRTGHLAHEFEEREKELLNIGERLGLRGAELDKLHADAIAAERRAATRQAFEDLKSMTMTVIDGDFPRELLARENLTFPAFAMNEERNNSGAYEATHFGPAPKREGTVQRSSVAPLFWCFVVLGALATLAAGALRRRRTLIASRAPVYAALVALVFCATGAERLAEAQQRSSGSVVEALIDRLAKPDQAATAVEALVALGTESVPHLAGAAVEGPQLAARGWAIVALAEIGGRAANDALGSIVANHRQPALVRTWAGAARVRLAPEFDEVVQLAKYVRDLPALTRPIGKRLEGALTKDGQLDVVVMLDASLKAPQLNLVLTQLPRAGSCGRFDRGDGSRQGSKRASLGGRLPSDAGEGVERGIPVGCQGCDRRVRVRCRSQVRPLARWTTVRSSTGVE